MTEALSQRRPQRAVPAWALPVLLALPLWAVLYAGSFGEEAESPGGLVEEGSVVYRSAGCSSCHGAAGQGSAAIPGIRGVTRTFPDLQDHEQWIVEGSVNKRGDAYGQLGRVASGGMPAFGEQLTAREILAVVCYERVVLAGEVGSGTCSETVAAEGASPQR